MPSPQLPNYLRANRMRLALLQADVALLLGKRGTRDVIRYEKYEHIPNLETALAYEAIFKIPVSELFGGLYQNIEASMQKRTKLLEENKKRRHQARCRNMRSTKVSS